MQTKKTNNIDLDGLLSQIGDFGKYQILIILFVTLPALLPVTITAYNQIFMNDVPPHWCYVPELESSSQEQRRNLAIPLDQNKTWNSCQRYAINWTQILQENNIDKIVVNTSWPIEDCPHGYEYDTSEISSSLVMDFDLVCSYAIYPTIGLFVLNSGNIIGSFIFGYVNDKYGRKKTYFVCLTILLIGNIISVISPNFAIWAFSRFITGSCLYGLYSIPFILSIELVGPEHRSLVTAISVLYSTSGLFILCALAYLIPNWVNLTLATSMPFVLYYFYWFILPESPRWLLTKGRYEEVTKMLETIARVNKKTPLESFSITLRQEIDSQQSIMYEPSKINNFSKIGSLFRTPNMRLYTILLCFIHFVNKFTYVGLNIHGPALGSNPFVSFALSALVEIPSYFFMHFTIDRWGRRWPFSLAMIVSGLSAIATVISQDSTPILIFYLISKCASSASMSLLYLYEGEIFPTEVRGLGTGISGLVGSIGPTIAPFIVYLGHGNVIIPLIIIGILILIGGVTALRLPETMKQSLPETVEEREQLGENLIIKNCFSCVDLSAYPRTSVII